jgi:uncharacterized protein with HEPN domain
VTDRWRTDENDCVRRTVDERTDDILAAVARARVADKRMGLAQSLADDTGMQIAFQAILHNLFVISEAIAGMPQEILDRYPQTPWHDIAAMRDVTRQQYLNVAPDVIHRDLEAALDPLEQAVRKVKADEQRAAR